MLTKMNNGYSDAQIDTMLDLFFRDNPRPAPAQIIADAIGEPDKFKSLYDFIGRIITGVSKREKGNGGPLRSYTPTSARENREGRKWYPREDQALDRALLGAGQTRKPPVDIVYIAAVLSRTQAEIAGRFFHRHADPLKRKGFGLTKHIR